jgi:hypothetical protein
MNDIRRRLRNGARTTAAEAEAALAADPTWAQTLQDSKGPARYRLRGLVTLDYSDAVADALLPARPRGRPVQYDGIWAGIRAPVRASIDASQPPLLPVPIIDSVAADWTPKAVDEVARHIAAYYENPTSAAIGLTGLRAGLTGLGVSPEVQKHSARQDVTARHNAKIAAAREVRVDAGIEAPAPFKRIADLIDRVDAYLGTDANEPSAQNAADLLVAFSARPGEAETIRIGEHGGVEGALKKRGVNTELPLVTSIGVDRARAFLDRWRAASQASRRVAMRDMRLLVSDWGLQPRDLRAIGAGLAQRAAALDGSAKNDGQAREVHRGALRHVGQITAQDHYTRVNDDLANLFARIAELSPEDIEKVAALVDSLEAGPSGS